jgi:hypothetical protein
VAVRRFRVVVVLAFALGSQQTISAVQDDQASRLHIVVVEGEDAINIVQQRTAVAPVVEVRDRNGQPVSGAVVRFAITKGRGTFSGARALTVTTNAAGRAAVSGLAPTGAGTLQISATAAFQGQTAVATIVQTNVMTVAQAAAVAAPVGGTSGGAGGSAAAGGGAGGGGMSATTISVIGAAAAGGTLVAVREISADRPTPYEGPYSGVLIEGFANSICTVTHRISGTLHLELYAASDGSVKGYVENHGTREWVSSTCFPPNPTIDYGWGPTTANVTGTTADLRFVATPTFDNGNSAIWDFKGAVNGNVVTGTLDHTVILNGFTGGGVEFSVTLTAR